MGGNWHSGPQVISDNPNLRTICLSEADGFVPGESVTYTLDVAYRNGERKPGVSPSPSSTQPATNTSNTSM